MNKQTRTAGSGTFEVSEWESNDYDIADGISLARVTLRKRYQGALTGSSTTTLLTTTSSAGPAAYVGMERLVGSLNGEPGVAILRHSVAEPPATALLVPAAGQGAFAGLGGVLTIETDPDGGHHYTLELVPA